MGLHGGSSSSGGPPGFNLARRRRHSDLRILGKPECVDTVLDLDVAAAITGEEDPTTALQTIYGEWQAIRERLGREDQKAFYRAMMGMD